MESLKEKLISYLKKEGKHSFYQSLPQSIKKIVGDDVYCFSDKSDASRFDYIRSKISFTDKKVLDIGCNLGYFTFSAIEHGATHVAVYEGFKPHADFVLNMSEFLGLTDKILVNGEYYSFAEDTNNAHYDIAFLLNVLHHVGDDYGDKYISIKHAKNVISKQLNSMLGNTEYLIFQLGFNWKGNPNDGLFEKGTKRELIDYVTNITNGLWNINSIGIAVKKSDDAIVYSDLNESNVERQDELGEFLNRPIFILKRI